MSVRLIITCLTLVASVGIQAVFAESGTSPARGKPSEYDPGPTLDSKWPDLFAATPNYRGVGQAVMGGSGDKFRWYFGPMFYRGRLTPNSVKVFVVGQEGAQDENVSNRSFTGSTGTKMQNFLSSIGITQSYLFMNTFVYTITGQYTDFNKNPPGVPEDVRWLAQDLASPIVKHRHSLFDYMYETNKSTLALIVGVGTAGKDSVVTWVRSRAVQAGLDPDATCPSITQCQADFLGNVKVLGVVHPGGASALNGGAGAAGNIVQDFSKKFEMVKNWKKKDPNWLPSDQSNFAIGSATFKYKNVPVPHRDFPYGAMWSMGNSGTSSNRETERSEFTKQSIHVFSENGCYNALIKVKEESRVSCAKYEVLGAGAKEPLTYDEAADLTLGIPEMAAEDVAWEPPKSLNGRRQYDQGPNAEMAKLLQGELPGLQWPDFKELGITADESFGRGPMYRGRLDQAQVLIIADQESQDDLFSSRAWTGTGGQKLQTLLAAMGVTSQYAVLRTLPVDSLDLSDDEREEIVLSAEVKNILDAAVGRILANGKTELVLTIGQAAGAYVKSQKAFKSLPVFDLEAPDVSYEAESQTSGSKTFKYGTVGTEELTQWNKTLKKIQKLGLETETTGSFEYSGELTAIPRIDLPYGTRFWIGTSGSRVVRGWNEGKAGAYSPVKGGVYKKKGLDPDYYKIYVPGWVSRMKAPPLSPEEKAAVAEYLQ